MSSVYGFKIEVDDHAIKSINGIDSSLLKLERDSSQATSKIQGHFSSLGGKIKSMFGGFGGMMAGATGLGFLFGGVELAKSSLEAFDKREESLAKLNAALKSTHSIAGLTAESLEQMAGTQSGKELFSKSAIEDAQSMLLTFTQVRGKIFNEAMPAISDFATRFKMELPEAANMVGKALNDPLRGLTRLQRQGVVFSEQQKLQIQQFMMMGDVASAQRIILGELGTEFGGLAEAMTKTDSGKLKMAVKELTAMKLTIGEVLSKGLVGLTPVISKIGDLFHSVFGKNLVTDLRESQIHMNGLFNSMKDSNKTYDEKKSIINELNANYPQYLRSLITDKMTTEDINKVQRLANDAMIQKIEIEVKNDQIKILASDYAKKAQKFTEADVKYQEMLIQRGINPESNFNKGLSPKSLFVEGSDAYEIYQKRATALLESSIAKNTFEALMKKLGVSGGLSNNSADSLASRASALFKELGIGGGAAGSGMGNNAVNTSMLGGAAGGLGEAKQIRLEFKAPLLQINVPGGNGQDIVNKADMTIEQIIRVLNNLVYSQGATM